MRILYLFLFISLCICFPAYAESLDTQQQFEKGLEADKAGNDDEALKWYLLAAKGGHRIAQNNLGEMYAFGLGIEQNKEEALKWYLMAASHTEDGNAYFKVGRTYYELRDYENALEWLIKSAELGAWLAIGKLGDMYYTGNGVEKNNEEAIKWYTKLAELGEDRAQYKLGKIYYKQEDYNKSFVWLSKAAEQDHAYAQEWLGALYVYGRGVDKDIEEGKKWLKKSHAQGNDRCMKILEKLEKNNQE